MLQEILNLNNIDSIGRSAFTGCKSLTSFIVPNNVSTIAEGMFENCESLQSIVISDNVKRIQAGAFTGCSELVELHIPEHLTEIIFHHYYDCNFTKVAFDRCSKLSSFSVSEKNSAFSAINGILYNKNQTELLYCPEGIKGELTIPSSVCKISRGAFRNSNINSIIIGENVRELGSGTFYNCISLTTVKLHEKLKIIGPCTFVHTGLTNIELPENIEVIEKYTFTGCKALTNIVIPNKVRVIKGKAFGSCIALDSITISESVKKIWCDIFNNCVKLRKISVYWQDITLFPEIEPEVPYMPPPNDDCILEVPFGTKEKYANHPHWKKFKIIERKQ
jgi:hypothetical protein